MASFSANTPHDHTASERIGVLVTNLGTPDAPTPGAVRRYLAEFLADPRVIEAPRLVWRLILHGVVLRIRPRRSAHAYASIWTPEGSPLLVNSRAIADALDARWTERQPGRVAVALGMRYGDPSIPGALHALREAGATRIAVLPLYPQYSGATGGSTFDAVAGALSGWRRVPALRFIDHYHDDPGYTGAIATSIRPRGPRAAVRTGCCSRSTACRGAISTPATPTTANAARRRASSPRRSTSSRNDGSSRTPARSPRRSRPRGPRAAVRTGCCSRSTACRGAISTPATPTTANAARRRASSPRRSTSSRNNGSSRSSRGWGARSGCDPTPTRR